MLNFKRSLLLIVGLLCAICFAACGNAATPTNGVAAQGDANNNAATVTVVPTAQPQKTAEAVKVQSQNQKPANQNQNQQGTQNQAQQSAPTPVANNGNQQAAQSNAQAGDQNMQQNPAPQNNGGNGGGSGTVVSSIQISVNGQLTNVLTTGNGLALYYRTTDPAPGSTCTGACAKAWPPFIAQGNVIPADNFQGQLTAHATANGNQVEYNGHPLYTYSGDNAKGQLNGQGVDNGVWNAVTVIQQKQHW